MDKYEIPVPHPNKHSPNWAPKTHPVIRDEAIRKTIHVEGFKVIPLLDADQVKQLREIYSRDHTLNDCRGGMFYSVYSQDIEYRKRIHNEIGAILRPAMDQYLVEYKNVLNSFVIKVSGPQSEFSLHQDMTGCDENKYSPLTLWIPLQEITESNGAMAVLPKSHWFFSPYRGISFPFPFSGISDTIRDYLQPVYLKAGEAILFDPRILHNSSPNQSGKDRVSIVAGIFPPEADFIACYQEPKEAAPIELISLPDEWILENLNFLIDCHARPQMGKVIGTADFVFPQMNRAEFLELCKLNDLKAVKALPESSSKNCNMIGEPIVEFAEETAPMNPEKSSTIGFLSKVRKKLGI